MKLSHVLCCTLAFAALAIPMRSEAAKTYKLSMSTIYSSTHPTTINGWIPWIKTIQEETSGRVVINYFEPNTICPLNELYSSVVSGAVDIGGNLCGATPGRFPAMEAPALPLLVESATAGSLMVQDFYDSQELAQKDFGAVKVLWL